MKAFASPIDTFFMYCYCISDLANANWLFCEFNLLLANAIRYWRMQFAFGECNSPLLDNFQIFFFNPTDIAVRNLNFHPTVQFAFYSHFRAFMQ